MPTPILRRSTAHHVYSASDNVAITLSELIIDTVRLAATAITSPRWPASVLNVLAKLPEEAALLSAVAADETKEAVDMEILNDTLIPTRDSAVRGTQQ